MLIVLEGLPGSGKTTLARALQDHFNGKYIPEVVDDLPARNKTPHSFFMRNDLKKHKMARRSRAPHIFMDRNYLSTLAYSYCKDLTTRDSYLYQRTQYWLSLGKQVGDLYEPQIYLYLKLSPHASITRQTQTNRVKLKGAPWLNEDFLKHCTSFYESYLQGLDALTKVYCLDANLPASKLFKLSCKIIEGHHRVS